MKRLLKLIRMPRIFRSHDTEEVHFHRGPQGQPTPCYDPACERPHLSVH